MQDSCVEAMPDRFVAQWHHAGVRSPRQWIKTSPLPQTRVCVIVPVRNEAEQVEATLTALLNQVNAQGQPLDPGFYEVIVFANNCTDASAAIVRRFAQQHPSFQLHLIERTLPTSEAYIGRVRQILMDEAYERFVGLGQPRGIIASTDGDTQVDREWIAAICHEIEQGADAVGGRIITDRSERAALDHYTRTCYLRTVGYHHLITQLEDYLDPDPFDRPPRHHQFLGASFAVTCEMYALAGGLPPVRTSEDIAFRRALITVGARLRHSFQVQVVTSARQTGRTANGWASQLRQWQIMGQDHQSLLVDSAAAIEARLRAKRELRHCWAKVVSGVSLFHPPLSQSAMEQLANQLAVPLDELIHALERSISFGDLYQRVEQYHQMTGIWQQRWATVQIDTAITDLRLRLEELRQTHSPSFRFSSSSFVQI